jgi:hypothetical protein
VNAMYTLLCCLLSGVVGLALGVALAWEWALFPPAVASPSGFGAFADLEEVSDLQVIAVGWVPGQQNPSYCVLSSPVPGCSLCRLTFASREDARQSVHALFRATLLENNRVNPPAPRPGCGP